MALGDDVARTHSTAAALETARRADAATQRWSLTGVLRSDVASHDLNIQPAADLAH